MEYDFAFHNSHIREYRSPFGAVPIGSKIKLKILTNIGADAYLKVIDFYDKEKEIKMNWEGNSGNRSLFSAILDTSNLLGMNKYYFIIKRDGREFYYGNNNEVLGGEGNIYYSNPNPYQITVYEDSYIPEWFQQGIIYQIFVDRFCNGNKDGKINNPKKNSFIYDNWYDEPRYIKGNNGEILKWDFFGGNLRGVINKLDYLKDLGITIIYFNPIFESVSCHKYDTGDYENIDPMFGTEEDFIELCKKAKSYGIKIILDGVFSHTGEDSKYFNRYDNYKSVGAYQSKESKYFKWYRFSNYPDDYECWWGFKNQPDVDELNPSYLDYIVTGENSVIAKWMKLGASGWRLDVADELPDKFIELLKKRIREIDNDSILVGEVWEDASNKVSYSEKRKYLFGRELDSVTNYPLRDNILNFVKGNINGGTFAKRIYSLYENYPINNFYSTMNLLGNHDTERIFTVLNEEYRLLELALVIQMIFPGVPLVYYGDEAGLSGFKDPSNRKTYPWGRENTRILNLYKRLIDLRKNNPILLKGDFFIYSEEGDIVVVKREYKDKSMFILLNNSFIDKQINLKEDPSITLKDVMEDKILISNDKENYLCKVPFKGYRILKEI